MCRGILKFNGRAVKDLCVSRLWIIEMEESESLLIRTTTASA